MAGVKELLLIIFTRAIYSVALEEQKEFKEPKAKRILVFGGNGFIGSETVRKLLDGGDSVTIVNRGNWYFDSEERIKPFVSDHLKCDREQVLRLECPQLLHSGDYDAVIDFSSYNSNQVEQAIDVLQGRVGLYVYISTDSVYEVCDKDHKGPTKEEDAVRPKNRGKRLTMKRQEKYGHEKLACEEELRVQRQAGGFPYVALRLPDVIGPRDNSMRFWTYQLWVQTHKAIAHPVHLPDAVAETKFSLVHVEDVAKAIVDVVDAGNQVYDQAINLAFEEEFTLRKLIEAIARKEKVDLERSQFFTDDELAWYTYPTVSKGPLDTARAKALINWKPMAWDTALNTLTEFYNNAMTDKKWVKEKEMVLADFFEFIVQEQYYEAFLMELKRIYGKDVFDGVDLDFGGEDDTPAIEGGPQAGNSSTSERPGTEEANTTQEKIFTPGNSDGALESGKAGTKDLVEQSQQRSIRDAGSEIPTTFSETESSVTTDEAAKHEEL